MALRKVIAALGAAGFLLAAAAPASADEADVLAWSKTTARGLFELCRADAPDAAAVGEHGEVWGWPRFMGYLEHPDGYKREAGGESRLTHQDGDLSAYVEATVQSGIVTEAKPDPVRYFRCNMASDQSVGVGSGRLLHRPLRCAGVQDRSGHGLAERRGAGRSRGQRRRCPEGGRGWRRRRDGNADRTHARARP